MEDVLSISKVSKHFKSFILNNININIKENCITGFLGKNGTGKTTLIKIILGLVHKDEGEIHYFSNPNLNKKDIKDRLGVVLDEGYFYDNLTLNEMKDLVSSTYTNWNNKKYENYIKRFKLDGKQLISSLSKGMKMKYALALALSHNADLLIMDEPTSGLDPEVRKELMQILSEYVQQDGKSVFFSTHITSDLEQVADEIIIINNGEILEQVSKDELLEEYRLIKGNNEILEKLNKSDLSLINKTNYGFSAITNKYEKIRKEFPEIIIERTNLNEIFLAKTEVY
ncbi:ABC transporter ATP-binding protein [Clostridium sp. D2Q-11]|uniref:ABC transporter ATP-binding protein n=1 Tax=Anaeromonas frigoriresistens TaxID=2683708 RepID=A0A942UYZ5_9FIRM|nr:ABC transporter ATP-binding protein [Anaeromonas frigoriresistens]MBS4539591.1 ABC transporter ATP-binding protein [Anaeromonas frigoriresistens]